MSRVEFAPEIIEDFDRILAHLAGHNVEGGVDRIQEIVAAIDILQRNPEIGRPTAGGNRELVIGRGSRGFVALYRYLPQADMVVILAIRSQREAGYTER